MTSTARSLLRTIALTIVMLLVTVAAGLIHAVRPFFRRRDAPLRSLWAGNPIPTLAVKSRAERLLGVQAETLVYTTYFLTDDFDHDLTRVSRLPVLRWLAQPAVFLWACARFDRFHFFCNRGLLPSFTDRHLSPWELRLYRWLGKEVLFWTYGADVRTRKATETLGLPNCCMHCPAPGKMCICDDDAGAANFATIRRHAHAVFSMGDMIHYTPGSRNDVFFWPVDLDLDGGRRYAPRFPSAEPAAPLRVVHAPNHRFFKGSDHLIEAVRRLQAAGVAIELELVEGVPNHAALEIYRAADVAFDQCLIGFHGYFAQEAMALGKPVLCFIRDPQAYLLAPDECPIISTPPQQIEAVLRSLAEDRTLVRSLGERGRRYIERYHTPARFAARLRPAYEDLGLMLS